MTKLYYSLTEVSKILNTPISSLKKKIKEMDIKFKRNGRFQKFTPSQIEKISKFQVIDRRSYFSLNQLCERWKIKPSEIHDVVHTRRLPMKLINSQIVITRQAVIISEQKTNKSKQDSVNE